MKYNGNLDIATGASRGSRKWKNKKWAWAELVQKLSECTKTHETFKEYMSMDKSDQDEIKDIGGYVGGYLRNGRRAINTIVHRQLLTLDIDFAHMDFWDDYTMMFGSAAVLHSTHKHHSSSPRFRLIIPLSRECSPDEYSAVGRRIAGDLGIDLFDGTTFEVNRLMYWPSSPKDVPYYFQFQDGPWADVDKILASYIDWTDTSLWPTSSKQLDRVKNRALKQEDPESKKGLIGAFCRAYPVEEAISKFLEDEYSEAQEGRYTYTKGSTSGGLVIYDGKFAFSHHGTDPSSGKLCNSFDLVRIHKFGHLDEGDGSKKSFQSMQDLVMKDEEVKKLIASENLSKAQLDFDEDLEQDVEWTKGLEFNSKGDFLSNAHNLEMIFANDPRLSGVFRYNVFDCKRYIFGNMPWRRTNPPEPLRDVDYSGIRNYMDKVYGITGTMKIEDSMALEFEKNSYHPIRDFITSRPWDGVERVDTLLIDYFGVEDSAYHRQSIRKTLVAGVARVYKPGIKFDLVLTLVGPQGTGKSTFVNKLGGPWFSDTFLTVHGKEAFEQIQGAWIIEMAELAGLKKAEVESIKHFISKQEDMFRKAYGRVIETYPRQCIFIGTTNNKDFLRDPSGNRRFLPIDIDSQFATKNVFKDLNEGEVQQIWAEAYEMFKSGEALFMIGEAHEKALEEQSKHSELDDREGIIQEYLERLLPKDWGERDIMSRRVFIEDPLSEKGKVKREYVCAAEVWCECLGHDKRDMDRYKTRQVNEILKNLKGWEASNSTRNFIIYGKQKYYQRTK